jgi:hypothetical protein
MRLRMILTFVALSACGGSQPPAATPGPGGFDAMSHGQKMAFMKSTVFPKMKAEFQAYDASDYADFTCKSCHGSGANGDFKMPNPDLPKLDVAHNFAKDTAEHAKTMDFMLHKVKPEMAQMLGQPEYSETNKDGFGCMDCHTPAP